MQSNVVYVNLMTTPIEKSSWNPFESGFWSSRYYQYDSWHGPHRLSLSFDSESCTVTGNGSDDVGTYTIDGLFSIKTNRIGLTKTYQRGTGNPAQNFGHHVTIQMSWNDGQRRFEGKWSVQTSKYSGENKFELELEKALKAID